MRKPNNRAAWAGCRGAASSELGKEPPRYGNAGGSLAVGGGSLAGQRQSESALDHRFEVLPPGVAQARPIEDAGQRVPGKVGRFILATALGERSIRCGNEGQQRREHFIGRGVVRFEGIAAGQHAGHGRIEARQRRRRAAPARPAFDNRRPARAGVGEAERGIKRLDRCELAGAGHRDGEVHIPPVGRGRGDGLGPGRECVGSCGVTGRGGPLQRPHSRQSEHAQHDGHDHQRAAGGVERGPDREAAAVRLGPVGGELFVDQFIDHFQLDAPFAAGNAEAVPGFLGQPGGVAGRLVDLLGEAVDRLAGRNPPQADAPRRLRASILRAVASSRPYFAGARR